VLIFEVVVKDYISKNYDAIKKMACTIAKQSVIDCEELCHIVVLSILESDQSKIEELIKKKTAQILDGKDDDESIQLQYVTFSLHLQKTS